MERREGASPHENGGEPWLPAANIDQRLPDCSGRPGLTRLVEVDVVTDDLAENQRIGGGAGDVDHIHRADRQTSGGGGVETGT